MGINGSNKNMVLDQKYRLLDSLKDANKHLENKTSGIVQTGGVILGLVAAFGLVGPTRSTASMWALGFAFLFFIISIITLLWSLYPKGREYPGTSDWDDTFTNYLYQDDDACFEQVLSNTISAIQNHEAANEEKAQLIIITGGAFGLQIVALLVFVVMA